MRTASHLSSHCNKRLHTPNAIRLDYRALTRHTNSPHRFSIISQNECPFITTSQLTYHAEQSYSAVQVADKCLDVLVLLLILETFLVSMPEL